MRRRGARRGARACVAAWRSSSRACCQATRPTMQIRQIRRIRKIRWIWRIRQIRWIRRIRWICMKIIDFQ